ncbi:RNA polymerase subunit sigma [Streptomyces sp. NBC_01017]|uniref:RNA polymerase subunit sigma n=1 Tax=Streptomyces sp. NBC_01017 TaxID=2903721 RepID=UPI0038664922|nr:RNA polymerase subunit sigma [Streptomyces sp. NBC_01017]
MAGTDDAVPIAELLDERRHLLHVAYWMLGSSRAAENVIDETYRRWFELPEQVRARITAPRSWLAGVAGSICLTWPALPELDRAGAVADLVRRTDSRGAGSRGAEPQGAEPAALARHSLRARHARPTSARQHDTVARAVHLACVTHDEGLLTSLLAADATAFFDGGGKVRTLIDPVHGNTHVARTLLTLLARHPRTTLHPRPVNGRTGLVVRYGPHVAAVISLDVAGPHVVQVWGTLNPDKLRTWNRPSPGT